MAATPRQSESGGSLSRASNLSTVQWPRNEQGDLFIFCLFSGYSLSLRLRLRLLVASLPVPVLRRSHGHGECALRVSAHSVPVAGSPAKLQVQRVTVTRRRHDNCSALSLSLEWQCRSPAETVPPGSAQPVTVPACQ
jgi:hypothetical protein